MSPCAKKSDVIQLLTQHLQRVRTAVAGAAVCSSSPQPLLSTAAALPAGPSVVDAWYDARSTTPGAGLYEVTVSMTLNVPSQFMPLAASTTCNSGYYLFAECVETGVSYDVDSVLQPTGTNQAMIAFTVGYESPGVEHSYQVGVYDCHAKTPVTQLGPATGKLVTPAAVDPAPRLEDAGSTPTGSAYVVVTISDKGIKFPANGSCPVPAPKTGAPPTLVLRLSKKGMPAGPYGYIDSSGPSGTDLKVVTHDHEHGDPEQWKLIFKEPPHGGPYQYQVAVASCAVEPGYKIYPTLSTWSYAADPT